MVLVMAIVLGPGLIDSIRGDDPSESTSLEAGSEVSGTDGFGDSESGAAGSGEAGPAETGSGGRYGDGGGADEGVSADDTPGIDSGLPTIARSELPVEATDTLALIRAGGPYPFDKDGSVFQNREGYLPSAQRGHYREFTVITPGESTRGARRIVAGDDGALFWTDDHYASFSVILS